MATFKPTVPQPTAPPFELSKHPEFRVVHINGFYGGLSPTEGRLQFFTDIIEPKIKSGGNPGEMEAGKIVREVQIEIRMSPLDFVGLGNWINDCVKRLQDAGIIKK